MDKSKWKLIIDINRESTDTRIALFEKANLQTKFKSSNVILTWQFYDEKLVNLKENPRCNGGKPEDNYNLVLHKWLIDHSNGYPSSKWMHFFFN